MIPILVVPCIVAEVASPERQQIGSAWMEQDGTIIMRVRMAAEDAVGDAEIRCAPGSAGHEQVRRHLPSLAPERSVPVCNDWD